MIARHFDFTLEHCSGDDVVSGPGRPQERINRYIAEMDPDLSIFVFKDRFGTDAGLGMTPLRSIPFRCRIDPSA